MGRGRFSEQVFDHIEIAKLLASMGFVMLGEKHSLFSTYTNPNNSVVSYYINKKFTPKGNSAYVFIHGKIKEYAYDVKDFKKTYETLMNKI